MFLKGTKTDASWPGICQSAEMDRNIKSMSQNRQGTLGDTGLILNPAHYKYLSKIRNVWNQSKTLTWMKSSTACFHCCDVVKLYELCAWPCPLYLSIDWLQIKCSFKVWSPKEALIHKTFKLCWFTHSPDSVEDLRPLTPACALL